MKNRIIPILAVLFLTLAIRPFIAAHVESIALRQLDREQLEARGLPVTPELMRMAEIFRKGPPSLPVLPSGDKELYDRFLEDGCIRVGVYLEPPERWERYGNLLERSRGHELELIPLRSGRELRNSLAHDDIVIFSGHSNYGLGLTVWNDDEDQKEFWQIPGSTQVEGKTLDDVFRGALSQCRRFPEKVPPVLMMLGCRSGAYYAEPLARAHPDSSFVFTNYLWAPDHALDEMLGSLLYALSERAEMESLLLHWEDLYAYDQLAGRQSELKDFDATIHSLPDRLFFWEVANP